MEIKNYKKGDEKHILKLFKLVFGTPMSPYYWKWRFENNPAGKHKIKLMWEANQLVGHYAVSPVKLTIEGDDYFSALSMTTMTHPEFGGKGIFGLLANALYEELENDFQAKAIWGFPNTNSHYGFIKKLGWRDLSMISHLSIPIEKINPILNDKIRQFDNFTIDHENIIVNITSEFPVAVKRDADYMNWRYIDNPTSKYDRFEWVDNGLQGFVLVKKYPSAIKSGIYDLYITEIGIELSKISLLPQFLSHIAAHYAQKEATLNTWLSLFDKRYIHFEKTGFNPVGKPTYFGVRPNVEMVNVLTDFRNWYYSYGDSDVY